MQTAFLKMHGAGNDFMVVDARANPLVLTQDAIRGLADRRTGVGWDQLIVLDPPGHPDADLAMRIFNPDGSSAGACGNATRCVADLSARESGRRSVVIQTVSGLLPATRTPGGDMAVDMGVPGLEWWAIPLAHPCDTLHLNLPGDPASVSIGNPHATLFLTSLEGVEPAALGPALEHDALFPDRANIGFALVLPHDPGMPDRIRLRVWERGAGLTRACGSGACAALVNAHRRGLTGRRAHVLMDGGMLLIEWRERDSHVLMTGPSVTVFQGTVDLATTQV